jgi:hypothetical protein
MKATLAAFGSGALFAVGLAIGGMTQPSKIIGFLDFFGDWDPSLAFVMGGAVSVYFVAYRLIHRRFVVARKPPLAATRFTLPSRRDVDVPLLAGAALFGAGWAVAGYCPGPAIASLGAGSGPAIVFVIAMLAGMALYRGGEHLRARAARGGKKESA